jgi:hypothetical protein
VGCYIRYFVENSGAGVTRKVSKGGLHKYVMGGTDRLISRKTLGAPATSQSGAFERQLKHGWTGIDPYENGFVTNATRSGFRAALQLCAGLTNPRFIGVNPWQSVFNCTNRKCE